MNLTYLHDRTKYCSSVSFSSLMNCFSPSTIVSESLVKFHPSVPGPLTFKEVGEISSVDFTGQQIAVSAPVIDLSSDPANNLST